MERNKLKLLKHFDLNTEFIVWTCNPTSLCCCFFFGCQWIGWRHDSNDTNLFVLNKQFWTNFGQMTEAMRKREQSAITAACCTMPEVPYSLMCVLLTISQILTGDKSYRLNYSGGKRLSPSWTRTEYAATLKIPWKCTTSKRVYAEQMIR